MDSCIIGLETSTTFEYSSIIESSSSSILIESNAGISPTDVYQLNTLKQMSSDAEKCSCSIFASDRKQTSASFQTENFETIDTTNALYFMNTTSLIPNSVLSSMSLTQNFDTYKTSIQSSMTETVTISSFTITFESDYQSTLSYFEAVSSFSKTTFGFLTPGVYMTTAEISPGLIYSTFDSSFSPTTEVWLTNTLTETVSTYMTPTETVSSGLTSKETISPDMTSIETVSGTETLSTDMTSIETVGNAAMTSIETVSTDMTSIETVRNTGMSSTETVNTEMSSSETVSTGMSSTETVSTGMTSTDTLRTDMTSSYKMFDMVSEGNETTSITYITDTNVLSRYSLSADISVLQTTFDSFASSGSPIHQHMESLITSTGISIFTSIAKEAGFSSSFTLEAPHSTNTVLTPDAYESQTKLIYKNTSDSQFTLNNSDLSGTSGTILFEKGDLSTTPLRYSSVIDTVKHTSNVFMTSSFNEQSVSETQNFLTKKLLIQSSSVRNNEAGSTFTERHSSLPTKLFPSMPDTVSSTYNYKFILLTSTEHILLVTRSLYTLVSFTSGIENSVLTTESFVQMISRSSNELATSSSSLDTFSPQYAKTTTTIQNGLSESSKDDIFISAMSCTIGAVISVVLLAMVISRYFMKRTKFEDKKDDKISNQLGWSDEGGMNSYNKKYTSREYKFNSSIHLPLHSYNESPYFPFANNYKKNWEINT